MPNLNQFQKTCQLLLSQLSPRAKEIVSCRFGLVNEERKTLEAIGGDLGLTRERVRQIIIASIGKMKKFSHFQKLNKPFFQIKDYLQKQGGLKREDLLFSAFSSRPLLKNWLFFLLALGENFYRCGETNNFYPFWTKDPKTVSSVQKAILLLKSKLEKEKQPLDFNELVFSILLPEAKEKAFLESCLEVSKEILKSFEGKFGLKNWPEVNPRGVKDLSLLVFKKEKKPLHFVEVAKLINEFFLDKQTVVTAGALPPRKKANFQTVHNELIRDPRFILVGRGVYALRDWGYSPGTVKEVIGKVLKEAKKPLEESEIVKRVLSQRFVKENTILLNLGNKKWFMKTGGGKYAIREA